MELVDVVDSKSTAGDSVPVRVRSPAPKTARRIFFSLFSFCQKSRADWVSTGFFLYPMVLICSTFLHVRGSLLRTSLRFLPVSSHSMPDGKFRWCSSRLQIRSSSACLHSVRAAGNRLLHPATGAFHRYCSMHRTAYPPCRSDAIQKFSCRQPSPKTPMTMPIVSRTLVRMTLLPDGLPRR